MAKEAGLTGIVLNPKSSYIDSMLDWQDPLYQKIMANLPPAVTDIWVDTDRDGWPDRFVASTAAA